MQKLADAYTQENPDVKIEIKSIATTNYDSAIKTQFAKGTAPDIFCIDGYHEMQLWQAYLEDLSDRPWVSDMLELTKAGITDNGATYGLPLNLDGYGIIYNKRLLREAGIEKLPHTLKEFKAVCERLEADGIPALNIPMESWHTMGTYFINIAMAHQPDPETFMQGLSKGTETFENNKIFNQLCDLLDVMLDYAYADPLSYTISSQLSDFADEKVAMTLTSYAAGSIITALNPDIELGMMIAPINNDSSFNDVLFVGTASYWVVNKESPNKEDAKRFLDWMVSSNQGRTIFSDESNQIPGLVSLFPAVQSQDPLVKEIVQYLQQNRTLGLEWPKYPSGMTREFGTLLQKYCGHEIDRATLLEGFTSAWNHLSTL